MVGTAKAEVAAAAKCSLRVEEVDDLRRLRNWFFEEEPCPIGGGGGAIVVFEGTVAVELVIVGNTELKERLLNGDCSLRVDVVGSPVLMLVVDVGVVWEDIANVLTWAVGLVLFCYDGDVVCLGKLRLIKLVFRQPGKRSNCLE